MPAPTMMTEFDGGEVGAMTNVKGRSRARASTTAETFIFSNYWEFGKGHGSWCRWRNYIVSVILIRMGKFTINLNHFVGGSFSLLLVIRQFNFIRILMWQNANFRSFLATQKLLSTKLIAIWKIFNGFFCICLNYKLRKLFTSTVKSLSNHNVWINCFNYYEEIKI